MLQGLFLERFADLLAAWRQHDELRGSPTTSLVQLADSREHLDELRNEVNEIRRAFAPEPSELESVLVTTYCDVYSETVFLYARNATWSDGATEFHCACGQPVHSPVVGRV